MPEIEEDVREVIDHLVSLLQHPGFRFLQKRMDAEKHNAILALCDVHPENTPEIIRLQQIVARSDYYVETIKDLIESGLSVEDLNEQEETTEDDGQSTDEFDDTGA